MGSLIFGALFVLAGFMAWVFLTKIANLKQFRNIVSGVLYTLGVLIGATGSASYNDAGYCQHVRTIFGTESSVCTTGWYFSGWGNSTAWP